MLSIPEPCNEDFSKMTPTERGAFCSKCKIDTFDFRDLSNYEINKIILKNQGKHLCGQFTDGQLKSLNTGFSNWKNQQKKTFRSKFVFALLLVFGLSLFSCDVKDEAKILELQQISLQNQVPTPQVKYVNQEIDGLNMRLLDFVEEIIEEKQQTFINDDLIEEIAIEEVELEEKIIDEQLDEVLILEERITMTSGMVIMGGAFTTHQYINYLEDTVSDTTVEESLLPEEVIIDPDLFEATVYPNPTTTDAKLALDIADVGQFEILLFDMRGKLIRSIYSGELVEGRQNFEIELFNEQSGMYILKVISENQQETLKIQKLN